MEIGMLWFDNDKKASIPNKVEKAARYYHKKYGVNPDLCYMHPQMYPGGNGKNGSSRKKGVQNPLKIGQITVLENEQVMPDHLWIGISGGNGKLS
jgi:hypothetical protein